MSERIRALAPLWARVVLAAAMGSLAGAGHPDWRVVVPVLASAAIGALAWPDLRLGRIAAAEAAALAGLAPCVGAALGGVPAVALASAVTGAALSALPRPGDPELTRPRMAKLACGGAMVASFAASASARLAALAAAEAPTMQREVESALLTAGIVLGLALGAPAARSHRRPVAAALLAIGYLGIGLARGDLRTRAEIRLDTGDVRTYFVGAPFLPVPTPALSRNERARIAEMAEGLPALRGVWVDCATFPAARPRAGLDLLALYAEAALRYRMDPRVTRAALEDVRAWFEATGGAAATPLRDAAAPEFWYVVEGSGRSLKDAGREELASYCHDRGFDPRDPAWRPTLAEDPVYLAAQADADGSRFVRVESLRRLATRFPALAPRALRCALLGDDPAVRSAAARALADLGDADALLLLQDARRRDEARGNVRDEFSWLQATTLPAYDDAIARLQARK